MVLAGLDGGGGCVAGFRNVIGSVCYFASCKLLIIDRPDLILNVLGDDSQYHFK